ncbi:MAG: hypothetical protein ACQXXF_08800, partial [Thermoplasmatota archaeon]
MSLKKVLKNQRNLIILLCTAAILLFFPGIIRIFFYEKIPGGTINYKDVIIASKIFLRDFSNSAEQPLLITPYHLFLNFLTRLFNPLFLMNFLAPVF